MPILTTMSPLCTLIMLYVGTSLLMLCEYHVYEEGLWGACSCWHEVMVMQLSSSLAHVAGSIFGALDFRKVEQCQYSNVCSWMTFSTLNFNAPECQFKNTKV